MTDATQSEVEVDGVALDMLKTHRTLNLGLVTAIDFYDARSRSTADVALRELESRLVQSFRDTGKGEGREQRRARDGAKSAPRGRTWITRRGIFVDRIASAWLIRRFIDADATFVFVDPKATSSAQDGIRFDMFNGEYTHEGDRCTFETLMRRFGLDDPALRVIATIVHDIDLKDAKFAREDAAGIERVLAGSAAASADDHERLARGSQLFDELHVLFGRGGHG